MSPPDPPAPGALASGVLASLMRPSELAESTGADEPASIPPLPTGGLASSPPSTVDPGCTGSSPAVASSALGGDAASGAGPSSGGHEASGAVAASIGIAA